MKINKNIEEIMIDTVDLYRRILYTNKEKVMAECLEKRIKDLPHTVITKKDIPDIALQLRQKQVTEIVDDIKRRAYIFGKK